MTHYEFFRQIIGDIESVGTPVETAIISSDGMVVVSNITDLQRESHMAAYAAVFIEYGNRMSQCPGQTNQAPVDISLNVNANDFTLVTRLDERLMLILRSADRQYIAPLMKACLAQIDRMKTLSTPVS